jgi:hypothetical protein
MRAPDEPSAPDSAGPAPAAPIRWAAAGAAVALFALATRTSGDTDLWGHLRFGLDILRTHHLTAVDPYSFTQDRPWVNHEWLSELQMAVAYAVGGGAGLALLKGGLAFAAIALVWFALAGVDPAVRMVAIGLVAFGTAPLTRTLRPQLWSMVCLAMVSRVLVEDRRAGRWWLPVLFGVWANLHGGWIVGLAVLGLWAAADVVARPRMLSTWAPVVTASALATLCSPYGSTLWIFLRGTVGMSRNITEWQALWTASFPNWLPWIATTAAALWAIGRTPGYRLRLSAVLVALAYASARVMRVWPLYVECAAIFLAPALRARWPQRAGRRMSATQADAAAAAVVLLTAVAFAVSYGSSSLRCIGLRGDWVPDPVAARALDGGQPGRLVVFFDWGEYAIWHWGPSLKVSMDGRRETVYSDTRLAEHQAVLSGTPAGLSALDTWRAEYVWLPSASTTTKQWLATHGYRIEVDTSKSFVAVREDLPRLPRNASATMAGCFPS